MGNQRRQSQGGLGGKCQGPAGERWVLVTLAAARSVEPGDDRGFIYWIRGRLDGGGRRIERLKPGDQLEESLRELLYLVLSLPEYQCGTWGPIEADRLIQADDRQWRTL